MKKNILLALDWMVAAVIVFSLLRVDFWPNTDATHQVLVQCGLGIQPIRGYPVWSWCVRWFGWNAATLSVLSSALCVGALALFCCKRMGRIAGSVVAAWMLFSWPVLVCSTRINTASFDAFLLSGVLLFVRKGKSVFLSLGMAALLFADVIRVGFARPSALLLDGVLFSMASGIFLGVLTRYAVKRLTSDGENAKVKERKLIAKVIAALVVVLLVGNACVGLSSSRMQAGGLSDAVADFVLRSVSPQCQWLVTDAILEDAIVRKCNARQREPFVVRAGRNYNAENLSNLVVRVGEVYPHDVQLRAAAGLSVRSFLEDLSLAETNGNAVAYVWGRDLWTSAKIKEARHQWARYLNNAHEPLREYVSKRLSQLDGSAAEERIKVAANVFEERLTTLSNEWNKVTKQLVADIKSGSCKAIREDARQILCADRMNPLGNSLMGALSCMEEDYDVAELYLRRAAASGKASPLVMNDLAETLRRQGKLDDAERAARKAVANMPDGWRVRETLADVLLTKDADIQAVEEAVSDAESLSGKVPDAHKVTLIFLRAAVESRKGNVAKVRVCKRRLGNVPVSPYLKKRIESLE